MNIFLFRFINQTLQCPFLDRWMPLFSDKDYVVIPGVVALGLTAFFGSRRLRIGVLALVIGVLIADQGSEKFLKNIVGESRPYASLENVHVHRSGEWIDYDASWQRRDTRKSNSFPSTHAANVAAVAIALCFMSRKTLWFSVPLVLLVGLSRVYTGNHYPADVLAGYVWGGHCVGWRRSNSARRLIRRVWGEGAGRRC